MSPDQLNDQLQAIRRAAHSPDEPLAGGTGVHISVTSGSRSCGRLQSASPDFQAEVQLKHATGLSTGDQAEGSRRPGRTWERLAQDTMTMPCSPVPVETAGLA